MCSIYHINNLQIVDFELYFFNQMPPEFIFMNNRRNEEEYEEIESTKQI